MTQPPVGSIFVRAWELLTRNGIIIVPGLVIGLVVGILRGLLTPPVIVGPDGTVVAAPGVFAMLSSGLLVGLVSLVGYIATIAYTTGMAGAAWRGGRARIEDGAAAFRADAGNVLVTALGLFGLAIVAIVLALPTVGMSLIAYYLFTLYAMPAAIIGNLPGGAAIQQSFRIAVQRFGPTLLIGLLIAAIAFFGTVFASLLRFAPLIGPIVAACVTQAVVAYATLVVVGEYLASPTNPPPPSSNRV